MSDTAFPDLPPEPENQLPDQLKPQLAALETADAEQLVAIWQDIPLELEDAFLAAADARAGAAEQAGQTALAERLRNITTALRQAQEAQRARQNAPPPVRALRAFLWADDEAAARLVFADQQALLQPYSAQQMLEQVVEQADDANRPHFQARLALLRSLRGGDPQPPRRTAPAEAPAPHDRGGQRVAVTGNQNQAGGTIYQNSAHAEGENARATVYNIVTIQQLERRWQPPLPPEPNWDTVPRTREVAETARLLAERGQLAISSRGRTAAVAVQGMPGVGKTTLAKLLATKLASNYPDGVLWAELGPTVQSQDDPRIQAILNGWASMAVLSPGQGADASQFEAPAVRALLAEHPHMLVLLDNVWSLEAIRPLRDVLPPGAHLVITTRSRQAAQRLGGAVHELGLLSHEDALALAHLRLGWQPTNQQEETWLAELFTGLKYHTLALDIALTQLALEGQGIDNWAYLADRILDSIRQGRRFEDLRLDDGEREDDVELVLRYSYDRMPAEAQARFAQLGAFAPGPVLVPPRPRCSGSAMTTKPTASLACSSVPRCSNGMGRSAGSSTMCCAAMPWPYCAVAETMKQRRRAMPPCMMPRYARPRNASSITCYATITRSSSTPLPGRSKITSIRPKA